MNVDRFGAVEKKNPSLTIPPVRKYSPSNNSSGLFARAHARRWTDRQQKQICALVEAALVVFRGTRGGRFSDEKLWAKIAWRVGPRKFKGAIDHMRVKAGEIGRCPDHPASAFQAYLNEVFPRPEKISRRDAEAQREGGAR